MVLAMQHVRCYGGSSSDSEMVLGIYCYDNSEDLVMALVKCYCDGLWEVVMALVKCCHDGA